MDDVTSTSYEEQANWAGTLKKALCSVRDHPMRIYDARSLGSLKFIGPAIQEVRARDDICAGLQQAELLRLAAGAGGLLNACGLTLCMYDGPSTRSSRMSCGNDCLPNAQPASVLRISQSGASNSNCAAVCKLQCCPGCLRRSSSRTCGVSTRQSRSPQRRPSWSSSRKQRRPQGRCVQPVQARH